MNDKNDTLLPYEVVTRQTGHTDINGQRRNITGYADTAGNVLSVFEEGNNLISATVMGPKDGKTTQELCRLSETTYKAAKQLLDEATWNKWGNREIETATASIKRGFIPKLCAHDKSHSR